MPHQCTGCGHTFEDGSKEMLSGCPKCGGNKFQFRPDAADFEDGDDPVDTNEPSAPEPDRPEGSSVVETVGRATTRMRDLVSGSEPPESSEKSPSEDAFGKPAEAQADRPTEAQTDSSPPDETSGKEPDPNAAWPDQSAPPESLTSSSADEQTGELEDGDKTGVDSDGEIIDADARRDAEDAEDNAQASARSDVVSEDELERVVPEKPAPETTTGGSEAPDSDGRVVSEPTDEEPDLADLREQLNDQFESIKIVEPGQYELNLMELYDREEYIIALQENGRYVIQVPEQWMGEDPGDR